MSLQYNIVHCKFKQQSNQLIDKQLLNSYYPVTKNTEIVFDKYNLKLAKLNQNLLVRRSLKFEVLKNKVFHQ